MKKCTLFLILQSLTAAANASPFYLGTDFHKSDINIAGETAKPSQIGLRLGYEITPQIILEAQYSISQDSDDLFRFEVDLEEVQAYFIRLKSREYNDFSMDVSLGYASNVLSVNGPEGTYNGKNTFEGFAWGIAANQKIHNHPNVSYRFAYQSSYDDRSLHIRGFSFGIAYSF